MKALLVPKVKYMPSGFECELEQGQSVFQAAGANGIMVETACGGKGTCGLCRVQIVRGGEHLAPPEFAEKRFIGSMNHLRLSCRLHPTGDVVVDVPPPRPPKKLKR